MAGQRGSVVDRYLAWAFHEGKIGTRASEESYRRALRDLGSAIASPLEEVSAADLLEYQFRRRHETDRTWNFRCSVIREFYRYLQRQEGRIDRVDGGPYASDAGRHLGARLVAG